MIIKVQRAINSDTPNLLLIYNKAHTIHQEMEDEVLCTAIGDRHKAYFDVDIDDNGLMHIKGEVKAKF